MKNRWRTEVKAGPSAHKINYSTPVFFIGSCFSDNMSEIMRQYKFPVKANPFGVLYNPYSIQTALRLIMGHISMDESDLVHQNGLWHSFLHHGSFSNPDKDSLLAVTTRERDESRLFLQNAEFLFITLGTAWVYRFRKTGRIVANCHKIPEKEFQRFRLTVCDIVDEFDILIKSLLEFNPRLKIIFTISPVRHWKDGAVENQLSKSILTVSVHQLKDVFEQEVGYFPAYEIVMDDLRDYRFYNEDMVHPSKQAVEYVFDHFGQVFFTPETMKTMTLIKKIVTASKHRPLHSDDPGYKKFCSEKLLEMEKLSEIYPFIDWRDEKQVFRK